MPMPKQFDHVEAYERLLAGESTTSVAEDFGVSKQAVGSAALRVHEAKTGNKVCVGCGAAVSISIRCRRCADLRAASNRRGDHKMRCSKCGIFKEGVEFRVGRAGRRHSHCKQCAAEARREYRSEHESVAKPAEDSLLSEIRDELRDISGLLLQIADTTPDLAPQRRQLARGAVDIEAVMKDVDDLLSEQEGSEGSPSSSEGDERLMVTRREAAAMLSVSLDYFADHIQPELGVIKNGWNFVRIPVSELERWVGEKAQYHTVAHG